MSSASLVCDVCRHHNIFPSQNMSIKIGDAIMAYCNTCSSITQQRVESLQTISPRRSPSPHSASALNTNTSINSSTLGPGVSVRPSPTPGGNPNPADEILWTQFLHRMQQNALSLDDFARCDASTKARLVGTLGFNEPERQKITLLFEQKYGNNASTQSSRQASPAGHPSVTPFASSPGGGPGGAYGATNVSNPTPFSGIGSVNTPVNMMPGIGSAQRLPNISIPLNNSSSTAPNVAGTSSTIPSHRHVPPQAQPGEEHSAIRGLSRVGDQLIARCSVYPELPAEFWCCACNVLVSSRCHVQGIHKDHPFITLRLAAEAHVRDLTAWNERCRSQLNVTESVLSNLRHAEGVVQQQGQREFDALEAQVQQIVEDLMRWKEQLRADMQGQMASQISSIQTAAHRTEELHTLYSTQLQTCEPLMANIPPVDQSDRTSEDWALKVLDFVSKLKNVNTEPIPMPRLLVPEVTCNATPATHMELLKAVSKPVGVRLPDLLDPGYFNFPQPAASARVPFTLNPPDDAQAKGIVVYNGRTLTRSQDVVPSHTLVSGSQVFYSGVVSWEVNIDRLGTGPGRVLAGVIIHGSEGEGIVWDGQRIVGPNEGECRTLDERYQMRPGTVLRFVLELEGPTCYLGCFFNRDGVARIPIPATGNGWTPAFSVFGPQDQVTVVPTSGTQRDDLTQKAEKEANHATDVGTNPETLLKLERQEHLIASLQQQLNAVHNRIDNDQYTRTVQEAQERQQDAVGNIVAGRGRIGSTSPVPIRPTHQQPATSGAAASTVSAAAPSGRALPTVTRATGGDNSTTTAASIPRTTAESVYSPELKQLMRQVNSLRQQT